MTKLLPNPATKFMQVDLKDRQQQLVKRLHLILTKQAGALVRDNLDGSKHTGHYCGI